MQHVWTKELVLGDALQTFRPHVGYLNVPALPSRRNYVVIFTGALISPHEKIFRPHLCQDRGCCQDVQRTCPCAMSCDATCVLRRRGLLGAELRERTRVFSFEPTTACQTHAATVPFNFGPTSSQPHVTERTTFVCEGGHTDATPNYPDRVPPDARYSFLPPPRSDLLLPEAHTTPYPCIPYHQNVRFSFTEVHRVRKRICRHALVLSATQYRG